jgi:hypothetical protein
MNDETQTQPASGPITIDDVRLALGDDNPNETNVNRLRERIGRGSFATIQKHLKTLRAMRVAAAQPAGSQAVVPKAPPDAVETLWAAAWGIAQAKTSARFESLIAELDGLRETTTAQDDDLVAMAVQLDVLDAQAQDAKTAQLAAQSAARESEQKLNEKTADEVAVSVAHAAALAKSQAEIARVTEGSVHAAQLAALTAQIERQALQSAIDRMHDQLAELKALHIVAATQSAAKEPKEPKK